jgi:hypothetical protein
MDAGASAAARLRRQISLGGLHFVIVILLYQLARKKWWFHSYIAYDQCVLLAIPLIVLSFTQ